MTFLPPDMGFVVDQFAAMPVTIRRYGPGIRDSRGRRTDTSTDTAATMHLYPGGKDGSLRREGRSGPKVIKGSYRGDLRGPEGNTRADRILTNYFSLDNTVLVYQVVNVKPYGKCDGRTGYVEFDAELIIDGD